MQENQRSYYIHHDLRLFVIIIIPCFDVLNVQHNMFKYFINNLYDDRI